MEGMDQCVRCKQRIGFYRDDVHNLYLCTECWQETDQEQVRIAALETFGEEQYSEGVDDGWTQALRALEEYALKHPKATAFDAWSAVSKRGE